MMKKNALRIALLDLILALILSQIALAEPSDTLKSVYEALVNGSAFRKTQAVYAENGEETYEASLEENAITFTVTGKDGDSQSWTFVQEGDWLTAPLGDEDDNVRGKAHMLLGAAVSAQGVNADLFFGYINAQPELQSKVRTYDESEGEKIIRINIVGPYEYDLDAMNELALSEEYLRGEGWLPLGEEYEAPSSLFGKVEIICFGNADGLAISVMEYGELDDLAVKAVVSAASVLRPRGWEDFVASYTELKDADEEGFTAILNPDAASSEDLFVRFKDGYSSAYFFIGQPWDWDE